MPIKKHLLFFSLAATLFSCIKEEDFDFSDAEISGWNPEVAVPLVNSSLTVDDIVNLSDSGTIIVDSTNRISILYTSGIYSINGTDFLNIPDQQDAGSITLNATDSSALSQNGSVTKLLTRNIPFVFGNSVRIDTMQLKNGIFDISIVNNAPHAGTFTVRIPNARKNGSAFQQNLSFGAALTNPVTAQASYNLSNYEIDFTQTGTSNQLTITYTVNYQYGSNPGPVTGKGVAFNANFNQLDPSFVSGFFGETQFDIPLDTALITLFTNTLTDSVYFRNPVLNINFRNSTGIPARVHDISIAPYNANGSMIPLITTGIPDTLRVAGAPDIYTSALTQLSLNTGNSNVDQVFAQRPVEVRYQALAITNNGGSAVRNFVTDTCKFSADLQIELPLDGWAKNLTIQDTADLSIENIEELESAIFRLNITNGFPLDAFTQIYFTDSTYQIADSLLSNPADLLIQSAITNSDGIAIQPTYRMHDEPYDRARLDRLVNARKLLIRSVLNTRNAPQQNVKIMDRDRLDVKIGIRGKLNLDN